MQGKQVLIVEDNIGLRTQIKEILTHRLPSIAVQEAGDAGETMRCIEITPPEVIIMDIHLPDINGIELTRQVKKRFPEVAVVVNTNYDSPEYRFAAEASGSDAFISKRKNHINDLVSKVESILLGQNGDQDQKGRNQDK